VAPESFDDLDLFQRWFKDVYLVRLKQGDNHDAEAADAESPMTKLQELIRPFLLRRRLVNLELPPKREETIFAVRAPPHVE
jgi:SNF2 family DNA or RNA helicase